MKILCEDGSRVAIIGPKTSTEDMPVYGHQSVFKLETSFSGVKMFY